MNIETIALPRELDHLPVVPGPETATIVERVIAHAAAMPRARAITFVKEGDRHSGSFLSWHQVSLRMRSIGGFLQKYGASGSRAIIACPAGLDCAISFLGCLAAGWIPIPAPAPASSRRDSRLRAIVASSGANMLLTTSALPGMENAVPDCFGILVDRIPDHLEASWEPTAASSDDVAFLQYTSGSTLEPRGVMVSHAALRAQLDALRATSGLCKGESIVSWLPLYHDLGLVGTFLHSIDVGAHLVLLPPAAFLRRPASWLEAVTKWRAVATAAPNFAFDLCCRRISAGERNNLDLSSLRTLGSGGELVRAHTLNQFLNTFGPNGLSPGALAPSFGMAESVLMLSATPLTARSVSGPRTIEISARALELGRVCRPSSPEDERSVVTCGGPIKGVELRIVDPDTGEFLAAGFVGEVWARGTTVALGYWGQSRDNAGTFGVRAADGSGPWLRTGDLGFLVDGELVVTSRRKEVIIVHGHNHFPTDIEHTVQAADASLEPGAGGALSAIGCRDSMTNCVPAARAPFPMNRWLCCCGAR